MCSQSLTTAAGRATGSSVWERNKGGLLTLVVGYQTPPGYTCASFAATCPDSPLKRKPPAPESAKGLHPGPALRPQDGSTALGAFVAIGLACAAWRRGPVRLEAPGRRRRRLAGRARPIRLARGGRCWLGAPGRRWRSGVGPGRFGGSIRSRAVWRRRCGRGRLRCRGRGGTTRPCLRVCPAAARSAATQVTGRVVGEGGDPVGAGAVQGGVDLGEGSAELLALGGHSGDVVLALLLVLGQGGQTLPQVALGAGRLLGSVFGGGKLLPGRRRPPDGRCGPSDAPGRLGAGPGSAPLALRPGGAG